MEHSNHSRPQPGDLTQVTQNGAKVYGQQEA